MPEDLKHEFWAELQPLDAGDAARADLRAHVKTIEAPKWTIWLASLMKIVGLDYGYVESVNRGVPVWGDGSPIPMYTYSLVEYLMGLDFSAADIAEFGGGESTRFWSARARSVTVFENDAAWVEKLRSTVGGNVEVIFAEEMAKAFAALNRKFSVIVVDCRGNRYDCADAATRALAPGGMIILDNSDWYPNCARLLREADLIEVDFPGIRPGRFHACATSIFLKRDFALKPSGARQPLSPAGGKPRPSGAWDNPSR